MVTPPSSRTSSPRRRPRAVARGHGRRRARAWLFGTFGPVDQIVARMVGIMALYGLATDYPAVHPADYVGPEVAARACARRGCLDDVAAAMVAIPADTFYRVDPLSTKRLTRCSRQRPRPRPVAVAAPAGLGTADTTVVRARVDALFDRCAGSDRSPSCVGSTAPITAPRWRTSAVVDRASIGDRLGGRPAANSCPS